jgi:hypothetical protein
MKELFELLCTAIFAVWKTAAAAVAQPSEMHVGLREVLFALPFLFACVVKTRRLPDGDADEPAPDDGNAQNPTTSAHAQASGNPAPGIAIGQVGDVSHVSRPANGATPVTCPNPVGPEGQKPSQPGPAERPATLQRRYSRVWGEFLGNTYTKMLKGPTKGKKK